MQAVRRASKTTRKVMSMAEMGYAIQIGAAIPSGDLRTSLHTTPGFSLRRVRHDGDAATMTTSPECAPVDGRMVRQSLRGLPDILGPDLSVIFCGINPGTTAAVRGLHFVSATNRFWLVLHRAGFTPSQLRPEDDRRILHYRCGLTVAVPRATSSAAHVRTPEMRAARAGLEKKIRGYAPQVVAFLGKAAFAAMTEDPNVRWGLQGARFAGAIAWVLPNPSGRNRRFRTEDLVRAYRELREYVEGIATPKKLSRRRTALSVGG